MSHLSSENKEKQPSGDNLPQLGVLDQETIARFRDVKLGPYRILKSDYDIEELTAAVNEYLSVLQPTEDLDFNRIALEVIASRPGLARVNTEKLCRHTVRLLRECVSRKENVLLQAKQG